MKELRNVIVGGIVVVLLMFGFVKMCQAVIEEQEKFGGNYNDCLEENLPSVCKRVFLD